VKDTRIVRNAAKIMSVRHNASFVTDVSQEHGSFGKFMAGWPSGDEVGLLELLAKRGNRLGGNTGQMLLRFLGWDGFVTSRDVVACLRDAGVDIADACSSHAFARCRSGRITTRTSLRATSARRNKQQILLRRVGIALAQRSC